MKPADWELLCANTSLGRGWLNIWWPETSTALTGTKGTPLRLGGKSLSSAAESKSFQEASGMIFLPLTPWKLIFFFPPEFKSCFLRDSCHLGSLLRAPHLVRWTSGIERAGMTWNWDHWEAWAAMGAMGFRVSLVVRMKCCNTTKKMLIIYNVLIYFLTWSSGNLWSN